MIGLLLVMPIVLAIDTEIKIKTMPFREVQVSASKSGSVSFSLIQIFTSKADEYGDASFVFNFTVDKYNLAVFIKEEGRIIIKDRQEDLDAGNLVYLELATTDFEFIETPDSKQEVEVVNNTEVNGTSNETVPIVNEEETPAETTTNPEENIEVNDTKSKNLLGRMAGSVVSTIKNNRLTVIYSVIAIVVIGGIVLILMRHRGHKEIKVTKMSDKINGDASRQAILDVEGKLKQIQDELDGIK